MSICKVPLQLSHRRKKGRNDSQTNHSIRMSHGSISLLALFLLVFTSSSSVFQSIIPTVESFRTTFITQHLTLSSSMLLSSHSIRRLAVTTGRRSASYWLSPSSLSKQTTKQCSSIEWRNSFLSSSTSSDHQDLKTILPTNEQIVQRRLASNRAKKATRLASLEEDRKRNLRLKEKLHNTNNNNDEEYQVPPMYAIKLSVCSTLRTELNMNGREKRGRVFIECNTDGCQTFKGLKGQIHAFFRSLKKSTYILSAGIPLGGESVKSSYCKGKKLCLDYLLNLWFQNSTWDVWKISE